jgi:hypothetical protein
MGSESNELLLDLRVRLLWRSSGNLKQGKAAGRLRPRCCTLLNELANKGVLLVRFRRAAPACIKVRRARQCRHVNTVARSRATRTKVLANLTLPTPAQDGGIIRPQTISKRQPAVCGGTSRQAGRQSRQAGYQHKHSRRRARTVAASVKRALDASQRLISRQAIHLGQQASANGTSPPTSAPAVHIQPLPPLDALCEVRQQQLQPAEQLELRESR